VGISGMGYHKCGVGKSAQILFSGINRVALQKLRFLKYYVTC
jgi:hypothetical protein